MVRIRDRFNSLPSEMSPINLNISELVQHITLKDLTNFNGYDSNVFYVNGNPWCLQFSKNNSNGHDWLGVYLHCGSLFRSRIEQLIVVTCDFQLIKPSLQKSIRLCPFAADNLCWGIDEFIPWNELMNGNLDEDECKFRIRLKATKLLNAIQNEWLHFQTISSSQNAASDEHQTKFRMTIHTIHHNGIGICSPNIEFIGCSWRIAAELTNGRIVVKILNTEKKSCRVSSAITLIPFDRNVQPVKIESENHQFNADEFLKSWELISWTDLIDPEKKFIQNGSLVIEVDLNAGTDVGDEPPN